MRIFMQHRAARFLAGFALFSLVSCGGSGDTPIAPGPQPSPTPEADFITIGEDGGMPLAFTEASGLPSIDCDPRIDWAASQIVLWHDFTGGSGPSGYEGLLDIMFPLADSVGTYTVQGNYLQAIYYSGHKYYSASPIISASSGTVNVTRSDSRIEGTYTFTTFDSTAAESLLIEGSFGIKAGWSLACP